MVYHPKTPRLHKCRRGGRLCCSQLHIRDRGLRLSACLYTVSWSASVCACAPPAVYHFRFARVSRAPTSYILSTVKRDPVTEPSQSPRCENARLLIAAFEDQARDGWTSTAREDAGLGVRALGVPGGESVA